LQCSGQNIKIELRNDEFTDLKGEIVGPPGTPYHGKFVSVSIYNLKEWLMKLCL